MNKNRIITLLFVIAAGSLIGIVACNVFLGLF